MYKKVFVNGTFDLLHRGHIELLNYAQSQGGHVCVGIDTDDRVREKKGPTRPIHNQEERKFTNKYLVGMALLKGNIGEEVIGEELMMPKEIS